MKMKRKNAVKPYDQIRDEIIDPQASYPLGEIRTYKEIQDEIEYLDYLILRDELGALIVDEECF